MEAVKRLFVIGYLLLASLAHGQAVRIFDRLDKQLDVTITSPATDQFLRYNGTKWTNQTVSFEAPLTFTLPLLRSSNTISLNAATTSAAGSMSSADKTKLDAISGTNTGDQDLSGYVPTTRTVNGHALSSNVTVTASDVGAPSGSGSSTGTNTGDQTTVSGNAGTATALQTARTINGTSFDGTANITVTAAAGTLTGSTLASGVTASSLTSFGSGIALGTPASGVATNLTGTAAGLTAGTVTTNANLTGPITSTGNATAIASQTGTGTTFVMNTSPTLVTPAIGAATATSVVASGAVTGSNITAGGVVTGTSSIHPLVLYVKNVTVLTTGTPADIATIAVPSGITRYTLAGSATTTSASCLFQETLGGGTNAAASFTVWDSAGGTGTALTIATLGLAAVGLTKMPAATPQANFSTSNTLYIRQTANSANAGTISFYIVIFPIP